MFLKIVSPLCVLYSYVLFAYASSNIIVLCLSANYVGYALNITDNPYVCYENKQEINQKWNAMD